MQSIVPAAWQGRPDIEMIVPITCDASIVQARLQGREFASQLGFAGTDLTVIITTISELARNIVARAKRGEIRLRPIKAGVKEGIVIVAQDYGPDIHNLPRTVLGDFSVTGRPVSSLSRAKRLADKFNIVSKIGGGTAIIVTKWRR
ncbi:MAG: ATP-binding protein [Acidobacteria bacterium]|nr:ATP-binding protein [Acidobacteriota bacterium]